jgi:protein-S-isoprenylcysteine O-methyltransferase Ste14
VKPSHDHHRTYGWVFVAIQCTLLGLIFLAPTGSRLWNASRVTGWAASLLTLTGAIFVGLSAIQLGIGLTPHPIPNGRVPLRINGLYRIVRHPMYSGVLLICFGSVLSSASPLRMGSTIALSGLFEAKTRYEETALRRAFPEYAEYAQRTRRFLPLPLR